MVQKLKLGLGTGTDLRLDVLNVGDTVYEIRNGTGVSVGAPQYGLRRTILAGVVSHLVRRYFGTQQRDVRLERELANEVDQSSRFLDQGLVAGESSPSQRASRPVE